MDFAIDNKDKKRYLSFVRERALSSCTLKGVRYLSLGVKCVRVLCYCTDAISLLEKEFSFVLKDKSDVYDATIVIWKESEIHSMANEVMNFLSAKQRMQAKAEMLWTRRTYPSICFKDVSMVSNVDGHLGFSETYDEENNTVYYSHYSFEPEVFVKQGHALVRVINHIVKDENTNLTHGAVFGQNNNGILLCGRGQRGKSTLTVESMLQGFEFVSDDYQILHRTPEGLFAYPIYSIIALSNKMYSEMKDRFKGNFFCNHFVPEKALYSIDSYKSQIRTAYPIRMCLFPEIVADEHPSIVACTKEEKGRAITHLVHSTVTQMQEMGEKDTIKKLYFMVSSLPFYKFNLCSNVVENSEYLDKFLTEPKADCHVCVDRFLVDISFGLATVFDTSAFTFITMNKFATNLFELMKDNVSPETIMEKLKQYKDENPCIEDQFNLFLKLLDERGLNQIELKSYVKPEFKVEYARKSEFKLSVLEDIGNNRVELLKQENEK